MAFKELSTSEKETVLQCMKAIADGPEIEDWEFHTRLGLDRPNLRRIISLWPEIQDSSENSDGFIAINNCLNEVCHGINISAADWPKWFTQPKEEVKQIYYKWLKLGGLSSSGLR
jgi:hypothetical protein